MEAWKKINVLPVQIPEIVQLVSEFDEFGFPAFLGCIDHLHSFSFLIRQVFVVRDFSHDTGHFSAEDLKRKMTIQFVY